MNFFCTAPIFWKNPFASPMRTIWPHMQWQRRIIFNLFPCDLRFERFRVRVASRSVGNRAGVLLNAIRVL